MRTKLKSMNKCRLRFSATFERYGTKPAYRGYDITTLLFRGVCRVDTGEEVAGHLWFTETKGFAALSLQSGDVVEFDARVTRYEKGYHGRRAEERGEAQYYSDYRLSHPTKHRTNKKEKSCMN